MVVVLIGLIIGILLTCVILIPRIKNKIEEDHEVDLQNTMAKAEYQRLSKDLDSISQQINTSRNKLADAELEYKHLTEENQNYKKNIQKEHEEFLKTYRENTSLKIQEFVEKESVRCEKAKSDFQEEYLSTLSEAVDNFQKEIESRREECKRLSSILNDLRAKVNAAVEMDKKNLKDEDIKNFHRINLTDVDISEIKKLREIIPYLRQAEPLNKVIWKVYYEKPTNDMISRVVGSKVVTGIYKITNIENNMCYIGQSVNVADRFKQHIKRGLGADTPTRNKLYPAMLSIGVENFTFEIIEECDRSLLDSREDYWQDFYHAKDYGYSIM